MEDHIQAHRNRIAGNIARSYNTDNTLKKAVDTDFEQEGREWIDNNLEKGGEGSRGGRIIGHTKSGKPIYMNQNAMAEKHYSSKDHEEAVYKHLDHNKETGKDSDHHATQFDRHMDSSRHKKAQEDVEKETRGIKKSEELTPGEVERQRVANNLQKAYTPIFEDPDYLEKGKKAEVGEIRTWGGVKYVKHQDGWVTFNQKTGKGSVYGSDGKKKMDASLNHIGHYSEHTGTETSKNNLKDSMSNLGYKELKAASKHMIGSKGQVAALDEMIDRAQRVLPAGQTVSGHLHAMEILDSVDDSNDVSGVVGESDTITLDRDHRKEDSGLKLDGTDNTDEVLAKYNTGEISKLHVEHHFSQKEEKENKNRDQTNPYGDNKIEIKNTSKEGNLFDKGDLFINNQKVVTNWSSGFVKLGPGGKTTVSGAFYPVGMTDGQLQGNTYCNVVGKFKQYLNEGRSHSEIEELMKESKGSGSSERPGQVWEKIKLYLGL